MNYPYLICITKSYVNSIHNTTLFQSHFLVYQGLPRVSGHDGNKFCFAFLRNDPDSSSIPNFYIYISTLGNTSVDYIVNFDSIPDITGTVEPDEIREVLIDSSLQVFSGDDSSDRRGIIVKAVNEEDHIQVFGFSDSAGTADVFTAVPFRRQQGIEFYDYAQFSSTVQQGKRLSMFVAVICEDNTILNIASTTALSGDVTLGNTFLPGRPQHISAGGVNTSSLSVYTTVHLGSNEEDLTGFRVSSTNPVGFMAGHACGQIPVDSPTCDHMIEQIPPSYTWGYNFISSPLTARISGYVIKIIPRYNGTTVTQYCNGTSEMQDIPFDGLEIDISEQVYCCFRTSRPCAVVQFSKGQSVDDDLGNPQENVGDPAMMWLAPVGQFVNYVIFYTGFTSMFTSLGFNLGEFTNVIVTADTFNPQMIRFDGNVLQPNESEWTEIFCPPNNITACAYGRSVTLSGSEGKHSITHDNPSGRLTAVVYGWAALKGYMYPAGFALDPIGGMHIYI